MNYEDETTAAYIALAHNFGSDENPCIPGGDELSSVYEAILAKEYPPRGDVNILL